MSIIYHYQKMTKISFQCLAFEQLNIHQLYRIMALRQEVFIVEQNCPYQDADGKDQKAFHLLGLDENGVCIAYARLMPRGLSYEDYTAIGRVLTAPQARGLGLGKKLLTFALNWMNKNFAAIPIKISAQCYLIRFYEEFGFQTIGESYLEDNIPHIAMIRAVKL